MNLRRYSCILGLVLMTTLPLGGCGESVSQPVNEQGDPVDPPEPPEIPAEGVDQREVRRPRSPRVFPAPLVAISHVRSDFPHLS